MEYVVQWKKCGRPRKFGRIKEPSESATNPTKVTREGKTVTCSNCKQTGHNKGTCKSQHVSAAPPRKRGRPKKCLENDDPWSIHNAPKRRIAQSQSTPPVAPTQSTQNQEVPQHSSAPPGIPSGRGRARGRPPGRGNGRGKARGREFDEASKQPVFFMSPWTENVFDVWQPDKN